MASITFREGTREDIPAMARVSEAAFASYPLELSFFPQSARDSPEWDDNQLKWRMEQAYVLWDTKCIKFWLAEDAGAGGKIVGVAAWRLSDEEMDLPVRPFEKFQPPPLLDVASFKEAVAKEREMTAKLEPIMPKTRSLSLVAVDPAYQGQHVGKQLVAKCVEEADAVQRGLWLTCRHELVDWYGSSGFTKLASVSILGYRCWSLVKDVSLE
ncbi:hypothetical protein BROUX41_003252 [Berkeleyomyces rouxiae]|uniref:uncharacterized protein n=1 Tax=Berkeleyomyces rouxiae TaxID=2035830 RepID=UPI003B7AB671